MDGVKDMMSHDVKNAISLMQEASRIRNEEFGSVLGGTLSLTPDHQPEVEDRKRI